jgi:hypothetical protein
MTFVPAHAVPRARVEAALADHAAGASLAEAAAAHGLSRRTLATYKAALGPGAPTGPTKPSKAAARAPGSSRGGKPTTRASTATEAVDDEGLLDTLASELRYARAARRRAKTDAGERSWSKRIEDLVKVIERLAPPPAPSPDEVARRLRDKDGELIDLVELHLAAAERTKASDIGVSLQDLYVFSDRLAPALAAELRAMLATWGPRWTPKETTP